MTVQTMTTHPAWCASHLDCTDTCFTTIRVAGGVTAYADADAGRAPEVHLSADTAQPTDLVGLDALIAALTSLRSDLIRATCTPGGPA